MFVLNNWQSVYPAHQMFAGFYEDIENNHRVWLRKLYRFLGVRSESSWVPQLAHERVHVGKPDKMPADVALFLARYYEKDICELARRFGGHADNWLCRVKEILCNSRRLSKAF